VNAGIVADVSEVRDASIFMSMTQVNINKEAQ
jgi:hypothetical protein